jgi:peroxiredoxin
VGFSPGRVKTLFCPYGLTLCSRLSSKGVKKRYGKTYMEIVRPAFLLDEVGNIAAASCKIGPKNTVPALEEWLAERTI